MKVVLSVKMPNNTTSEYIINKIKEVIKKKLNPTSALDANKKGIRKKVVCNDRKNSHVIVSILVKKDIDILRN